MWETELNFNFWAIETQGGDTDRKIIYDEIKNLKAVRRSWGGHSASVVFVAVSAAPE